MDTKQQKLIHCQWEDKMVHGPQQVDFRSVLAKKGTPKTPVPEKGASPDN